MSYYSRHVTTHSMSHLFNEIVDFMVNDVGWTDDLPTDSTDPNYWGRGALLSSAGEDAAQDLRMWVRPMQSDETEKDLAHLHYLSAAIDENTLTVPVGDSYIYNAGCVIRVDDELIRVGAVSSNDLTGCVRGYHNTAKATHTIDSMVQVVEGGTNVHRLHPAIEVFAYRDLATYLDNSATSPAFSMSNAWMERAADAGGIGGYGDDYFNWYCLVKMTSGDASGQWRWLRDYTDGGVLSTIPFQGTAGAEPSGGTCEIYSAGFHPAFSFRHAGSTDRADAGGVIGDFDGAATSSNIEAYMYGSLDGIVIATKYPTQGWQLFYAGNMVSAGNPSTATTTADITSVGATTVTVADTSIFRENGKYRIMSQDIQDWADNRDQSAATHCGATPGDWDNLDPEELASEEFRVVSIDSGTQITTTALKYKYQSGAIVGEQPRPMIRTSYRSISSTYRTWRSEHSWLPLYMASDVNEIDDHASHRQHSRALHEAGTIWLPNTSSTNYRDRFGFDTNYYLNPWIFYDTFTDDPNVMNEQYMAGSMSPETDAYDASDESRGVYQRGAGVIPAPAFICGDHRVGYTTSVAGGGSQDTMRMFFQGEWKTFRLFSDNGWNLLGPE